MTAPVAVHLFQIAYSQATLEAVEPGLHVLVLPDGRRLPLGEDTLLQVAAQMETALGKPSQIPDL